MPVLSDTASSGTAMFPDISITYIVLGAFLLALLGFHISRRAKLPPVLDMGFAREKEPLMNNQDDDDNATSESQSAYLVSEARAQIQKSPQLPIFTPPMRAQTDPVFSSFEAYEQALGLPPRRRSYTKTLDDGTEVNGQIVVAEGWRRHTKVFGGGVCQACEENERRLSA